MIILVVVAAYIFILMANAAALRAIDINRLQFIDGAVLGLTYYISIPMFFILLSGRIGPDFLKIEDYLPYEDLSTTFVIFAASLVVCGVKIYLPVLMGHGRFASFSMSAAVGPALEMPANARRTNRRPKFRASYVHWLFALTLAIYFASTIFMFIRAGLADGEHWYRSTADLMSESAIYIVIKYFANFTRTSVFGILAILTLRYPKDRIKLAAIGALVCVSDLLMTFNRITVIYLGVLLLIGSWNKIYHILCGFFVLLFGGVYIGSLWPEFRGQVSNYGYSLSGFADAAAKAIEVNSRSLPFVDAMNGLFESFSFAVLNWEVKHYHYVRVDFGAYFTRPLGVIIPRSIWPDRPESFALLLGRNFSKSELALNSYIIGEPFANSWLFWPSLVIIAMIANELVYRKLGQRDPAWGFIGAMIGFAWWRFDTSFLAVSLVISLIVFTAMQALLGKGTPTARAKARAQGSARRTPPYASRSRATVGHAHRRSKQINAR